MLTAYLLQGLFGNQLKRTFFYTYTMRENMYYLSKNYVNKKRH